MTITAELHSLIIYIVFGYLFLLPLLLLSLKIFNIRGAVHRLWLYLLAFLTPPAAFIIYHTVLMKRCETGHIPGWAESAFHMLCLVSETMVRGLLPLLGLLITFALLKAGAAALMIARLKHNPGSLPPNREREVKAILNRLSADLKIKPPELLISSRSGFAAYTAGFFKPVLVLNSGMADLLDEKEMQALIGHELVHISRFDTLKHWLMGLLRDIALLNPLSIFLHRGYLLEKEIICDREAAKLAGLAPADYAAILVKIWRSLLEQQSPQFVPVSSFTGSGDMKRRVSALLEKNNSRGGFSTLLSALVGIFLFAATILFLGVVC